MVVCVEYGAADEPPQVKLRLSREPFCLRSVMVAIEQCVVRRVLAMSGGSAKETGAWLGYKEGWVYKKLKQFAIGP